MTYGRAFRPARSQPGRKRDAEQRLPYTVDVRVIARHPRFLTEMVRWCWQHATPGTWEQHGHGICPPGDTQMEFARFYFKDAVIAKTFKRAWL
jgi:hypothetical protein